LGETDSQDIYEDKKENYQIPKEVEAARQMLGMRRGNKRKGSNARSHKLNMPPPMSAP
jgi:hypothetical protein